MKILVAYYSRTGTTKKLAEIMAQKLEAQIEEIKDTTDRSGAKGYLISGRDAMKKKPAKLEPVKFNPAEFDLVVIGTPVWVWNISSPIRAYLIERKNEFKTVAYFCTMGGSGDGKVFLEMEKITGKNPKSTLALRTIEVINNDFFQKLDKFLNEVSPS